MEEMEQISEVKKISVVRNALNYGALLGIAMVVLSLIFYILNMSSETWIGWIQFALGIAGIVLGILNYRNNINGGYISYGKSLGSGVLIGLFAAIITSIYAFVLFQYIDPGLVDKMLAMRETEILKSNPDISDADLEVAMNMTQKFMTPLMMAIMGVVMNTLYSFIASLIISIFTRKVDKTFEANFR